MLKKFKSRSDKISIKEVKHLLSLKYNTKSIAQRFGISYHVASRIVSQAKKELNCKNKE